MPKRIEGQPKSRSPEYQKLYRDTHRAELNAYSRNLHAERMAADPEYRQMKRESARWSRRRAKYDLSREEYQAMKTAQGGKCAICAEIPGHDLRVDHDHNTEKVRALLCANCNAGLGMFQEAPEKLRNAIEYLLIHKKGEDTLDLDA